MDLRTERTTLRKILQRSPEFKAKEPRTDRLTDILYEMASIEYEIIASAEAGNILGIKRALKNGVDVDWKDSTGGTPLIKATETGQIEAIKFLLKNGADINAQNNGGTTALIMATMIGDSKIVKLLIENGADTNLTTNSFGLRSFSMSTRTNIWEEFIYGNYNALMITAIRRDIKIAEILINKTNLDVKDNDGQTALMFATYSGADKIIKLLLENGADVNVQDKLGRTALMISRELSKAKLLIEAGSDIDLVDICGNNALFYAIRHGKQKVMELLIDNGANVNARNFEGQIGSMFLGEWSISSEENLKTYEMLLNKEADFNAKDLNGNTVLMHAIARHSESHGPELVAFLIENGADVNARNSDGFTPLMFLNEKHSHGRRSIVGEMLLNSGADVNARDSNGHTVLMRSIEYASPEVVKLLIDNGADVNARDLNGHTALWYAIESKSSGVIKLLIENGAKVNAMDAEGNRPLMWAASMGSIDMVKLLIEKGADVNGINFESRTPLIYARNNSKICKILLENGANVNAIDQYGASALIYSSNAYKEKMTIQKWISEKGENWAHLVEGTEFLKSVVATQLETIKVLLDNGADVNARDVEGNTSLIRAASEGVQWFGTERKEIIELLLRYGADPKIEDNFGLTAAYYASALRNTKTAKLLRTVERLQGIDQKLH
ncbi:MAG: ankyrin repeat domain-containing protein [Candidatus Micrarchaeota archaeon]